MGEIEFPRGTRITMLINRLSKPASLLVTVVMSFIVTHSAWVQSAIPATATSSSIDHVATSLAQASTTVMAERRKLLLERLQQLELDNERLRKQLTLVESSESVQSLQRVLDGHSQTIDTLRATQMPRQRASSLAVSVKAEEEFDARDYGAPAAAGGVVISSAAAQSNAAITTIAPSGISIVSPTSPHAVSPASVWSLEFTGGSGVLALMGALALLFVMTVLRKSYWMPRSAVMQRPPATVSERGLVADIATGYAMRYQAQSEPYARNTRAKSSVDAVTDQEQARRDQQGMARMLEQGLSLSDDDLSLMPERQRDQSAETKAVKHTSPINTPTKPVNSQSYTLSDKPKQARNSLSGEYGLLGSNGFCSDSDDLFGGDDLFDSADFDELFNEAAHVAEPSQAAILSAENPQAASGDPVRRSDEDVLRSIREKTVAYAGPIVDDGRYIVEEGCDDLDKYMDIQFIEPPSIKMDEAKERRDNRTFGL